MIFLNHKKRDSKLLKISEKKLKDRLGHEKNNEIFKTHENISRSFKKIYLALGNGKIPKKIRKTPKTF
jgi:hypothetical protein